MRLLTRTSVLACVLATLAALAAAAGAAAGVGMALALTSANATPRPSSGMVNVAATSATGPSAATAAFVRRMAPAARASGRAWRVPASVVLAQAVLESDSGRSAPATGGRNYFGVRCVPGKPGCRAHGPARGFRVYRSAAASFADHARTLATAPRYRAALRQAGSADRFARAVARVDHAADPAYAAELVRLMRAYDLYRHDR
ncbi:glucosaminidase domain-containing protein [Actinomadura hibisca]|uniref:glucosaminidase domain-containing protein n=1 Tax=Actinomadura hibisca TaxID=68565 RepID=UPI0012F8C5C0|nr:glucosaminidase domain-containing protein [Actinomadura hibisca]